MSGSGQAERRPAGDRAASEQVDDLPVTVPVTGDSAVEARRTVELDVQQQADLEHAREVRRIGRRLGPKLCGCAARDHDEACPWGLGPDDRAALHAQLTADPFTAPAMDLDAELAVLVRVRSEPGYASKVMRRFRALFGIDQ